IGIAHRLVHIVLLLLGTPPLPAFFPPGVRLTLKFTDDGVESLGHFTYELSRLLAVYGGRACVLDHVRDVGSGQPHLLPVPSFNPLRRDFGGTFDVAADIWKALPN